MRTETNKAGHPATESPREALFATNISEQTEHALAAAVGSHDTGFNNVDGAADSGSDEACHERGREMRGQIISHPGLLDAYPLESIV